MSVIEQQQEQQLGDPDETSGVVGTVTRAQIIAAAAETIAAMGNEISPQTADELMTIAETETRFLGSTWWSESDRCGCLVGYLLGHPPDRGPLKTLGFHFDRMLWKMVYPGSPYGEGWPYAFPIIEVVG